MQNSSFLCTPYDALAAMLSSYEASRLHLLSTLDSDKPELGTCTSTHSSESLSPQEFNPLHSEELTQTLRTSNPILNNTNANTQELQVANDPDDADSSGLHNMTADTSSTQSALHVESSSSIQLERIVTPHQAKDAGTATSASPNYSVSESNLDTLLEHTRSIIHFVKELASTRGIALDHTRLVPSQDPAGLQQERRTCSQPLDDRSIGDIDTIARIRESCYDMAGQCSDILCGIYAGSPTADATEAQSVSEDAASDSQEPNALSGSALVDSIPNSNQLVETSTGTLYIA